MLYETVSQPLIIFAFVLCGIISGIFFDFKTIFNNIFKKNNILKHLFSFFCTFLVFFLYFFINLKFNYGTFRFFTILIFFSSFFIERIIMTKFLAKPLIKCYNIAKEKRNGKKKT